MADFIEFPYTLDGIGSLTTLGRMNNQEYLKARFLRIINIFPIFFRVLIKRPQVPQLLRLVAPSCIWA
jgi:hypothetical protein